MSETFTFVPTRLAGLHALVRRPRHDQRGYLERMYCRRELDAVLGAGRRIEQVNRTLTRLAGTVRGMHFQLPPHGEVKVVSCLRGKVFDVAIDVRPIPATANQGLSPHDLAPQSTMTNAAVEATAAATEGNELTLNYKSGTVTVLVLPGTAMSQAAPGSRSDLKVGETVFVAARRTDAGGLTAARVQVSKDGVKPTQ